MGKQHENDPRITPRDGLDNTGTQGYDSLSDDAFTGSSKKGNENEGYSESHTGSRTEDFHDAREE